MYKRFLTKNIQEALTDTPVIFLGGPRQAGKSTLIQMLHTEDSASTLFTLDNLSTLSAARSDPQAFLQAAGERVIIDEVQRAPELFLPIKHIVDRERQPGRFLLTGSANILLLPQVADSLAGRMESFILHPLSMGEIKGKKEHFIDQLFALPKDPSQMFFDTPDQLKELIVERIILGGYPEVQNRDLPRRRYAWFESYVTTILQRDVRDMMKIDGLTRLPNLLKLLAARAGSLLNLEELGRTSGFPVSTLRRYFTLLQAVFLVHTLPAWSNNRGKRLVKSPKIYLGDTGLLCYLLGVDALGLNRHGNHWGRILENFVVNELIKIKAWSKTNVNLYHYRTAAGREVDVVLEALDGRLVGIEVKGTQRVTPSDFQGLKHLADHVQDKFVCGVLLYLGKEILSFGDRLYAIPITF